MRRISIALVAGLTLLAIGVGLTLLHAPLSVAATNKPAGLLEEEQLASTRSGASYCQRGETLPRGTSAIRIGLAASLGPRVGVVVRAAGHTLTGGEANSGWTGWVVAVPVRPLPHAVSDVTICASFRVANETLVLLGVKTLAAIATRANGRPLAGRMSIEYLRPGGRSWASLAASVLRNMGLGRAWAGEWIVFLAVALLVAVAILASRVLLAEMR
jgi:hypothetical protein